MELSVLARGGLCVCEEGACVPTNECGVFMRERRGGCPGDCRRGSFVESGDLLGSERGASPSLPRPLGPQGSFSPCSNLHLPLWLSARAGLQVPGASCWAAAFESQEPGAG